MKLPDGFVLDEPQAAAMPDGFVLDPHPGALAKAAEPITSYPSTQREMARSGYEQMSRGAGQMSDAMRFASSGAGRNLTEDNPNNRVAGGFDAMEGRQSPLTTGEYEGARSESVNNLTRGMGNALAGGLEYATSPINAALRTVVGKPIEENTGIPKEYSEFAAGFALPMPRRIPGIGGGQKVVAPTAKELEDAYLAVRNSPAIKEAHVPMDEVQRMATTAEQDLLAAGHRPTTGSAPRTFSELEGLTPKAPPGPTPQQRLQAEMNWETLPEAPRVKDVTADDLLAAKRAFGNVAGERKPLPGFGPTEDAAAASKVNRQLDDLIEQSAPGMKEANANYSAAKASEAIDRRIIKAERSAATNASGMNIGNKIRQQADQILSNPGNTRGLRPEEIESLKQVAYGTPTRNALRYVSHLLGGGGGLGAVHTADVASRSPLGALGTLTAPLGFALKVIENRMTVSAANKVSEAIRLRSPLGLSVQSSAQKWNEARDAVLSQPSPSTANLTRFMLASRNLSNNMREAGISVSPNEFFKSLQGPMPSRAADEQQ